VPSEKYGESIVAFVERHDRGAVEERQMKAFLRNKGLSPHKLPDFFVTVGDGPGDTGTICEFPLNSSGKILKTDLRRHAIKILGIH
jgi:fatty-acyl-CoA synthase